jgi:hypothetical protein
MSGAGRGLTRAASAHLALPRQSVADSDGFPAVRRGEVRPTDDGEKAHGNGKAPPG